MPQKPDKRISQEKEMYLSGMKLVEMIVGQQEMDANIVKNQLQNGLI